MTAPPTAVAHPCDDASLGAVVEAARAGIIAPILVGPVERIRTVAKTCGLDIEQYEIADVPHSHAAAARAVELVRLGRADLLMQGSLHTDELMSEVVKRETGLRTDRRDRKSTCLNSSHRCISYAVFCLKKKNKTQIISSSAGT